MNLVESNPSAQVSGRIDALIARYGAPHASAAELLCDDHDPDARAFRIIADDLSCTDLTYGELRTGSERFAAVLKGLGLGSGPWIWCAACTNLWRN